MTIINSGVAQQVVKKTLSEVGTLYFFNHLAVIEFNEGSHIDLTSVRKILNDLVDYYGSSKPFGIVANRINSYSISLLDIKDARKALPNLAAYGIVSYNNAGRMNAEIESNYCEWKDICYTNLYEGLDAIYKRVMDKIAVSLN